MGRMPGCESLAAADRRLSERMEQLKSSAADIVRAFRILKSWMFAFRFHSLSFREPGFALRR